MSACWACDEGSIQFEGRCDDCGAPWWNYDDEQQDRGVYIVQAECGLVKIGVATRGVWRRIRTLQRKSAEPIEVCGILWGANIYVELWLHRRLAEGCDPKWAADCGLPHASEWFWPTPSLRQLVVGETFLHRGQLWEDAVHEGAVAWPT
jgi:hypothetical protein